MNRPTRESVLNNPAVHTLTKQIIELAANKDIVDRVYDIRLALQVFEAEMDAALNR